MKNIPLKKRERKKKEKTVHCSVITFAPSKRPHSMSQTQIMVPVRPFPPLQWIAITLDWSAAIHRRTLSAKSSISLKNVQTLWLISFQPLKNFHGKSRAFQQSPAFPWKTCRHCDWSASSHWKTFMEKVKHFSKVQHFPENMHCEYNSRNFWQDSFQPLKNFLSKGQHFSENMQTLPAMRTSQRTGEVTVPNPNLHPMSFLLRIPEKSPSKSLHLLESLWYRSILAVHFAERKGGGRGTEGERLGRESERGRGRERERGGWREKERERDRQTDRNSKLKR